MIERSSSVSPALVLQRDPEPPLQQPIQSAAGDPHRMHMMDGDDFVRAEGNLSHDQNAGDMHFRHDDWKAEAPALPPTDDHHFRLDLGKYEIAHPYHRDLEGIMRGNGWLKKEPDFADTIRGPESHEDHMVMAELSDAAYGNTTPPEPWQVASPEQ